MMTFKRIVAAAALGTATMAPGVASADLSGNAGVMSEYLFRGLTQGNGASVYGGLDYSHESGFYVGTWAATINDFATGTSGDYGGSGAGAEVDIYAGFSGGDAVSYDVGVIYYLYTEDDEAAEAAGQPSPDPGADTIELYGSLGFGPAAVSAYYAPDTYFGVDDSAYGFSGSASFPLTDVLAFDLGVGFHGGDGNEGLIGTGESSYIDYSLGVSAGLENGFAFSFGFVATDIDNDDPTAVVDASYSFDLM